MAEFKLGITKEQRILAKRYVSRYRLTDDKVIVSRGHNGRRTLHLLATDENDIDYRIRFDKVKAMKPVDNRQTLDRLKLFIYESESIFGEGTYDYSMIKSITSHDQKLPIICQEHGVFYKTRLNHIEHSQGCTTCAMNRFNKSKRYFKK